MDLPTPRCSFESGAVPWGRTFLTCERQFENSGGQRTNGERFTRRWRTNGLEERLNWAAADLYFSVFALSLLQDQHSAQLNAQITANRVLSIGTAGWTITRFIKNEMQSADIIHVGRMWWLWACAPIVQTCFRCVQEICKQLELACCCY